MSKASDLKFACKEIEDSRWRCSTCTAPHQENSEYCLSCELYWNNLWTQFEKEFL